MAEKSTISSKISFKVRKYIEEYLKDMEQCLKIDIKIEYKLLQTDKVKDVYAISSVIQIQEGAHV
jgi:hypothetical protein